MTQFEMLEEEKYWCENCSNWDKEQVQMDGYAKCKLTGTLCFAQESGKECKFFNVSAENVIVSPCKVGDIVKHDAIYYRVYRAETYSDFETPIHHRYWAEPINEEGEDDFWFWSDRVKEGTVVVCSKEEAEQALKGR